MQKEEHTDGDQGTKPVQSAFGPQETPVVTEPKEPVTMVFPERPQSAFGPPDPFGIP